MSLAAIAASRRFARATAWGVLRAVVLLLGVCLLGRPMPAMAEPVLTSVEEIIVRADGLGNTYRYDEAIKLLQSTLDRYPTYTRLYLSLAHWYEQRCLAKLPAEIPPAQRANHLRLQLPITDYDKEMDKAVRSIFDTFGQAAINGADTREIRRRAADLVGYGLPMSMGEYGALVLPGDPAPFSFTLTDPLLPAAARGVQQGLVTTQPLPVPRGGINYTGERVGGYDRDPKNGWAFQRMLAAYEFDRAKQVWRLRYRVMWQDASGEEGERRAQLAQHTARLLLRLSALLQAYTGQSSLLFSQNGVLNVWLADKGLAGGEAYNDNIYLYEIGAARSATEWVREVAHEFGHETLPPVGGYEKPEWGANGRLGERLFMRWLLANTDPKTEAHPWVIGMDAADILENRINRLIRQYAALGPDMPPIRGKDSIAMDGFVGMALYLEAVKTQPNKPGAAWLLGTLKGMSTPSFISTSPKTAGFLESIHNQEAFEQGVDHPMLNLRLASLPTGISQWVYLRDGVWLLAVSAQEDPLPKLKVEINGEVCKPSGPGVYTTPALKATGWYRVRIQAEADAPLRLTGLRLVRQ